MAQAPRAAPRELIVARTGPGHAGRSAGDRHRPNYRRRPHPTAGGRSARFTALLIVAVIGSGIMASRLSPDDVGLQLLENAAATAGALDRPDLDVRRRLGRALQPRCDPRRSCRRRIWTRDAGLLRRRPGRRRLPRRRRRQRDVRPARRRLVDHEPVLAARSGCPRSSPPSGCCSSSTAACAVAERDVVAVRRRRRGSAAPTGSRPRPASPTLPSPSARTLPTASPASLRPRRRCSSPCSSSAPCRRLRALHPRAPSGRCRTDHRLSHPRSDDRCLTPTDGRPPCCSCACTTPAARRWPSAGSTISPASGPSRGPAAPSRPGDQPGGGRGHGRGRHRHLRRVPQTVDRRDRPRRRRRDHHGLRRRLPAVPGKRYEDWELDDPAGRDLDAVRPIRDEIRVRVEALLTSLHVAPDGS